MEVIYNGRTLRKTVTDIKLEKIHLVFVALEDTLSATLIRELLYTDDWENIEKLDGMLRTFKGTPIYDKRKEVIRNTLQIKI